MIGLATAVFGVIGGLDRGLADRDPADDAEFHLAAGTPPAWSPPPWSSRSGSGSPERGWP